MFTRNWYMWQLASNGVVANTTDSTYGAGHLTVKTQGGSIAKVSNLSGYRTRKHPLSSTVTVSSSAHTGLTLSSTSYDSNSCIVFGTSENPVPTFDDYTAVNAIYSLSGSQYANTISASSPLTISRSMLLTNTSTNDITVTEFYIFGYVSTDSNTGTICSNAVLLCHEALTPFTIAAGESVTFKYDIVTELPTILQ